ncbi:MAG: rhodanese-like domain-containing protein [Melioribacteraceae bacterium]|nr:rhodanese-like domain-containing protein [Melioribacteraceae bacterium]
MNLIDLDASSFKKCIDEDSNCVLIDVRTDMEFQSGSIANAIQIDCSSKSFVEKINKLDKTKRCLIYCHSGSRSFQVGQYMISQGFTDVAHLEYGIISWESELI